MKKRKGVEPPGCYKHCLRNYNQQDLYVHSTEYSQEVKTYFFFAVFQKFGTYGKNCNFFFIVTFSVFSLYFFVLYIIPFTLFFHLRNGNWSDAIGFDLAETFTRPALECSDHVSIDI
jgi:hypothetical protein